MKKTYIKPSVFVQVIKPCLMLGASGVEGINSSSEKINNVSGDARSSRFSRWEEDDFESEE